MSGGNEGPFVVFSTIRMPPMIRTPVLTRTTTPRRRVALVH